tara:strand:+ start:641 stop:1432 length:792 start_codon:yes stop_codon:yes gene_type:complete
MNKINLENLVNELKEPNLEDISSLAGRSYLEPKVWVNDETIRPDVIDSLMIIAYDFFDSLKIPNVEIKDIIFTGSLANYNWTEYSDIDLHILVDFQDIDENIQLVKDYFDAKRSSWNRAHDIKIKDHEVEIYVQDVNEPHVSTGVYSLMQRRWTVRPTYQEITFDEKDVKLKSDSLIDQIKRVRGLFDKGMYKQAHDYGVKLKDKIKRFRQVGLEREGLFSSENLAFKVLRNSEQIKELMELVTDSYDKMMSITENKDEERKS